MGIASLTALAQDGSLDTTFGEEGWTQTDFFGFNDEGTSVAIQDDGKIVVFGFAGDTGNPSNFHALVRYLPDGSLDPSFGANGKVTDFFDNQAYNSTSLHIQADQKIVTSSPYYNPEGDFLLNRYLPNGDLDSSFGSNGTVITDYADDDLASTIMLPDGKFLAGGKTVISGTENRILLTKYLPNGSLDPSFGTNGITTTAINGTLNVFGLKTLSDGKILVPYIQEENNVSQLKLIRYFENGGIDTSFGNGGILTLDLADVPTYATLAIKNNDDFLVAVQMGITPMLFQYFRDGNIDTSFGVDGVVELQNNIPKKLLIQADDKILVGGRFVVEPNLFMSRFNPDGTYDTSFGSNGNAAEAEFTLNDIALQSDNKILVAGKNVFGDWDMVLARLNNSPLGVQEQKESHITVWPNPSNGIFTIEKDLLSETDNYFCITNITGKILFTGNFDSNETKIDLSSVQSGMYFLKTANGVFRLLKN